MVGALDDIAFLANSENRVAILETFVEAPRTRDELRDHVDASRVTVTRILRELEARNWIENSGQEYAVTPLGDWICNEFTRLADEVEAEQRLRQVLQWVPSDLFTFDVRYLRDAETVLLEGSDPTAVLRRFVGLHNDSERAVGYTCCVAPPLIEKHWELTVNGNTLVEQVLTPKALNTVLNHSTAEQQLYEMLDETNAHYFVYEDIPISVGIVDGTVAINLTDEERVQRGVLITEDETVHKWAVDLFETYRDKARPVDPDVITA